MSFWSVPDSALARTPVWSATPMYMAKIRAAGRVDRHGGGHLAEVDAVEEGLHVDQGVDGDPGPADLALGPAGRRSRARAAWACRRPSRARRPPARSSSLKRPLVSAAVPKPANWRIVHRRERYMEGRTPRCRGRRPGTLRPRARRRARAGRPTWWLTPRRAHWTPRRHAASACRDFRRPRSPPNPPQHTFTPKGAAKRQEDGSAISRASNGADALLMHSSYSKEG